MDVRRCKPAGRDQVEQFLEAEVLASTDAQDRDELALGDRVVCCLAKLVGTDRFAFEVAHHQLFIELDDLLDHHLIRLARRQRAFGRIFIVRLENIDDACERCPLPDRHVERHANGAERLANGRQIGSIVDVFGVHLGHDDEPAQAEPASLLKDAPGVDLDAGWAGDGHNHVFDRGECTQGTTDEIGISGRVDQVNLFSIPREVPEVAVNREMPTFFFLVDVQGAGAVVYGTLTVNGAGSEEKGVGQCGFARRPMSSQGDIADISDMICRSHGVHSPIEAVVRVSVRIRIRSNGTTGTGAFRPHHLHATGCAGSCLPDRLAEREPALIQCAPHDARETGSAASCSRSESSPIPPGSDHRGLD